MEKQPYQKEYMRRIHVTQDYIEKHIARIAKILFCSLITIRPG